MKTTAIGVVLVAGVLAAACAGGGSEPGDSATDSAAAVPRVTREAAGDVAPDSVTASTGTWLDDANVLALVGALNATQIDAANVELGAWHSDTVRAFAATMLAEHDALQHTTDSLAAVLRLAPVAPALADSVTAVMQARVDSLRALRGPGLDREYLAEQLVSDSLAHAYLEALSGIAQRPEVQALLATADDQAASQRDRARTMQIMLAAADSVAADSLSRRHAATTLNHR